MAEAGRKSLIDQNVIKTINGYLVDYFIFIIVYVVLVLLAAGYFYLLYPKYKNIIKNNNLYQDYKVKEIDQLKVTLANFNDYKNIYDAISDSDKAKINGFLPNKDDSEELLVYIRNMMARGGYKLLKLEIGDLVKKNAGASSVVSSKPVAKKLNENPADQAGGQGALSDRLGVIDISLAVGGLNYSSLKNFLYFVERDARFFDIENITFSLSEGVIDLELKAYYLK